VHQELSATELAGLLGTDDQPFILDVREPAEVSAWAITGAVNIPLDELASRATEVPSGQRVVVVCASGNRSARAARALDAAGFDVANLTGGMASWGLVYDTAILEIPGARTVQVRRRGKGCLSYVIGAGAEAFVVDPSLDSDVYLRLAGDLGWRISRVFDTHLHADHFSGARLLADQTGASLHLNPADAFGFAFSPLQGGDRFELPGGVGLSLAAVHAPGHTPGSTVYLVGEHAVLSGDTLFVDGVGRPDLAERAQEFAANLYRSLHEEVLSLAHGVEVLPAHYGDDVVVVPGKPVSATLDELRGTLGPLSLGPEEFVAWATARANQRPPNYVEIVKANMTGAPAGPGLRQLELGPNRCSV
jgi:glyoxylase-like metal-dependent hydrolase (beta-lactamase superfamily II)/rhodanese-related sulfurtransferase